MLLAILFAFVSLVVILMLSQKLDHLLSTNTIILTGIVFSMFINSIKSSHSLYRRAGKNYYILDNGLSGQYKLSECHYDFFGACFMRNYNSGASKGTQCIFSIHVFRGGISDACRPFEPNNYKTR